jgi:hypothetical protein
VTFLELVVRMRLDAALKRERMPAYRERMAEQLVEAIVPEVAKMIEEKTKDARNPPALTRNERMKLWRRDRQTPAWKQRFALKQARKRLLVVIERARLEAAVERMGRYVVTAIAPEILKIIAEEVKKAEEAVQEVEQ